MKTLTSYQQKCSNDIYKGFDKNKYQCLAWYTGAGKTNIFINLCKKLIGDNPDVKIGISAYLTIDIKEQIIDRLNSTINEFKTKRDAIIRGWQRRKQSKQTVNPWPK